MVLHNDYREHVQFSVVNTVDEPTFIIPSAVSTTCSRQIRCIVFLLLKFRYWLFRLEYK
jgi:hypothetical protein